MDGLLAHKSDEFLNEFRIFPGYILESIHFDEACPHIGYRRHRTVVPAVDIHARAAIDLIGFYIADNQVPVMKPFDIGFAKSGMDDHNMGEGRSLFEDHLSRFELNFKTVAVKIIQLIIFKMIE